MAVRQAVCATPALDERASGVPLVSQTGIVPSLSASQSHRPAISLTFHQSITSLGTDSKLQIVSLFMGSDMRFEMAGEAGCAWRPHFTASFTHPPTPCINGSFLSW